MDTPDSVTSDSASKHVSLTDEHSPLHLRPRSQNPSALNQQISPIRLLLSVGGGLICTFLFLRAIVLEPFGVPTGSMAPALIGHHRQGICPRCDFLVRVGFPPAGVSPETHYQTVACPNCGSLFSMANERDLNGDRLLVDKNIFHLRKPRRWEMAVFHCPDTDPKEQGKPYVKRVVGLPGETILISNGEVYANQQLLRKNIAEVRETRFLNCDLNHIPRPFGWRNRWLIDEYDARLPIAAQQLPRLADDEILNGGTLHLNADPQVTVTATYRNWNLDHQNEEPIRAWNSYDGLPRSFGKLPLVHEFSIECDVQITHVTPNAAIVWRLTDGIQTVSVRMTPGVNTLGEISFQVDGVESFPSIREESLRSGGKYHVEYAFFDRRVLLAINGQVVGKSLDLPPIESAQEVCRPFSVSVQGCKLVLSNFKLYRDLYYTQYGMNGTLPPGRPVTLDSDEYFLLGDNSDNSQDSRKWLVPGVPETAFIGKPFLVHQPLRAARVTIGGRERIIQTIDWSRLRWLH